MSTAAYMLAHRLMRVSEGSAPRFGKKAEIRRGPDAIFGAGPYPRSMSEFVGQDQAKVQLMAAMTSAVKRQDAMDHCLFASGQPGIGKTTLAKIIASMAGRGYAEVGGNVTLKDVQPILESMTTGDILFLDEIHRLVSVKKTNAEWLLQLMTDYQLVLPTGTIQLPKITVIGATTDAQKLPRTILDRFTLQPQLEPYTPEQAVQIAHVTAKRLGVELEEIQYHRVAAAADYNPRVMARLLTSVRDLQLAQIPTDDVITTALEWTGVTYDGLTRIEQGYLVTVYAHGGVASLSTIKAVLAESVLDQSERNLIQKGYITICSKGRELTKLGRERAQQLLDDQEEVA